MRSRQNGSLNAILIVIPLLTVPLLAIFGIPQFAPVVASLSRDNHEENAPYKSFTNKSGTQESGADDLFAPVDSDSTVTNATSRRRRFDEDSSENWTDPFQQAEQNFRRAKPDSSPKQRNNSWSPPENALSGWERESPRSRDSLAFAGSQQESTLSDSAERTNPYRPNSESSFQSKPHSHPPKKYRTTEERTLPLQPISRVSTDQQQRDNPFLQNRDSLTRDKPLTWRSAVEELNQLGIRQFRLQPGERPNEFHFSCFFTPRDNPRITHRFEAEATEPLRAVQKVLDQIHEWLENR